jgi:hypothetical protein
MANTSYPYNQTQVRFSYKSHQNSRFDHSDIDTSLIALRWDVPTRDGYVYNDFGYERVQEIKAKYDYKFNREAQSIIGELQEKLEAQLAQLKANLEVQMAEELLVGVTPSKSKETV